jgi:plastocyanin
MKTLYFLTIIGIMCVSCFVLPDIFAQDCMGGPFCGGNVQYSTPAGNRNMTVSLNFYSNSTMPDNVHYLWLRFFDAKNDTLIKNVSFFINATKDDKVLMHELLYTKTGLMLMKFYPTHDTGKLIINGTSEPVLGGMMSENDTLPITTSVFAESGTYHIHLQALALVNGNELVDQNNPPTFDSWWSVDDKGNISQYDNSTTISFGSTTPSVKIKNESPLKQFKSGINISDIVCNEGLYMVVKLHDQDPMCLKAGTISKLASRGFLYGTSAGNTNYTTIIIPPGSENQASHNTYSPNNATVVIGINNTVQWINQADTANTIVSNVPTIQDGKPFDSNGVIKPGQSYMLRFTEPGTFSYHTEPHPWMKGTIIVVKNSMSAQLVSNSTSAGPEFKVGPDLLGPIPHQLVFFMKSNSTAKIFVEYTSHEPNTGTMPSYSSIYVSKGGNYDPLTTSDVTINANPTSIPLTQGADTVVAYSITAKEGVKGVYWISLTQFCGVIPLAIDINSLTISPFDIPVQTGTMYCPAQFLDRSILGISEGTAEYKVGQPVK